MMTFCQQWAAQMRNIMAQTGRGCRIPSFKLTERNAKLHPESRRNDKGSTTKAFRSYKARYGA